MNCAGPVVVTVADFGGRVSRLASESGEETPLRRSADIHSEIVYHSVVFTGYNRFTPLLACEILKAQRMQALFKSLTPVRE